MAKETTKKTTKKAAAKKTTPKAVASNPATRKVAAKKSAAKKATVKKTATKKTARAGIARPAPTPTITTIIAKCDVGFGNFLYVRGGGAGLSWEKGVLMGNAASDEWVWSSDAVDDVLEFKVLINDEIWATGENGFVASGDRVVIEPTF